jgi:anaerobic magnesium-protoporphyrin IX monomethyl ester cyclase
MPESSARALLLYPPITDPSSPYHSLVYVASYARANGFPDIEVRDTNIEALTYCARPDFLKRLKQRLEVRRRKLDQSLYLTRLEQLEYLYVIGAEALDAEMPSRAIEKLKDEETFYDYSTYRDCVRQLQLWMKSLSCESFPGQYDQGFNLPAGGLFSKSKVADLTNKAVLDRVVGPLREYFHQEFFPELLGAGYSVIGINVTYTSQLPYSLWLMWEIRRLLPDTYIVVGGTEISDVWKYMKDKAQFGQLFRHADACVIGEGETAFARILESLSLGKRPGAIANVVRIDGSTQSHFPPPNVTYENLDALPKPEYELIRSDLYFSPHRFIYYSPTRGCYWNKCTFCDYGLNFGTPTSPWRQRSLELVIEDLECASKYARHLYLSVDVLAPGALLKLAQAIADAKIDIRWSAEIRLEKYFNAERCDILRRSGCVAVSVGFESGSQRILDKINKGTRLDHIETTIKNFSGAGISVQMMGFTGFPSESYDEALESISYLKRNGSYWTVAGLGNFVLTPGAIVAQRPVDFNLLNVKALTGDDIVRQMAYRELDVTAQTPDQASVIQERKKELMRSEFDRPFAGGIDTAHSVFYYDRYERGFPQPLVSAARSEAAAISPDVPLALNGTILPHVPYNLLEFFNAEQLSDLHKSAYGRGLSLDSKALEHDLAGDEKAVSPVAAQNPYFLRSDGEFIPCSFELLDLLTKVDGKRTLGEILDLTYSENPQHKALYNMLAYTMARLRIIKAGQVSGLHLDAGRHIFCAAS